MPEPPYPQQQPPYQQPPVYPPPPPQKKGMPIWAWFLIGGAALALLAVVGVSIAAYVFVSKTKEMAKNPLSAIVQIAAAANPDLEVLDINEKTGKITIRDKKNNKTVVIDSDAVKDGKISIDSDEGHAELGTGANVKTPSWIYLPGDAKIIGGVSGDSEKGAGGSVVFTTAQSLESLKSFYEDKYKGMGFEQSNATMSKSNGQEGMQLIFANESRERTVTIAVGKTGDGVSGTIVYGEGQ
jgi:hypothetical protein